MEKGYKFIWTDENLEKLIKMGFNFKNHDGNFVAKEKNFKRKNDLVAYVKKVYSDKQWFNGMRNFGVDLSKYGLEYDENGLIENEKFKEMIMKFELIIDLTDDFILGITHSAEIFPAILQNKSILDKFARDEVRELKREKLIEVVDLEETGE